MSDQDKEDFKYLSNYSQTHDQLWLVRLYHKYEHLIYGVCIKYTNDTDWSKDLKSQIYEKLVEKAHSLEVNNFKSWLYSMCKNHCLDEIRNKKRKTTSLDQFRKFQISSEENVNYGADKRLIDDFDQKELSRLLADAVNLLSEQQKLCMDLFFYQRLSYLEICQQTGMKLGTVKSCLQNGKRKMKGFIHHQLNLKA